MDDERRLEPVPSAEAPDLCPFTQKVGNSTMVCTKRKHREEYGHNMVSDKEAEKYGWRR